MVGLSRHSSTNLSAKFLGFDSSPTETLRCLDSVDPISSPELTRPRGTIKNDGSLSIRPLSMCPTAASYGSSYLVSTSRMVRRFSDSLNGHHDLVETTRRDSVPSSYLVYGPKDTPDISANEEITTDLFGLAENCCQLRRYGTDSGTRSGQGTRLDGLKKSYDEWDTDHIRSTPRTTYAASVSEDGLSSLYDSTAFDFPEPPPIASPVIRRIQSTSWFLDGDHNLLNLSEPEKKLRIAFSKPLPADMQSSTHPNGIRQESPSRNHSKLESTQARQTFSHLSRKGPKIEDSGLLGDAFGLDTDNIALPWQGDFTRSDLDLTNCSISHLTTLTPQEKNITFSQSTPMAPAYEIRRFAEEPPPRPTGRLPRIIRKVASMRSDIQRFDAPAHHTPSGHVGRRTIPKARSFRSILRSSEVDQPQDRSAPFGLGGASGRPPSWLQTDSSYQGRLDLLASQSMHIAGSKFSTKADKNKQGIRASYILSKGGKHSEIRNSVTVDRGGLTGSVSRHPHRNYTANKGSSRQDHFMGPNSFIDISPDRRNTKSETKPGTKKERMKDFIASIGIFGWGKQLKSKQSSGK